MKLKFISLSAFVSISFVFTKPAEAQVFKLPKSSGIGCESIVKTAKTELANKGYYVTFTDVRFAGRHGAKIQPSTRFDKLAISREYFNYPPNRTEAVIFSGLKDYPPSQLMVSLSARIMADCPKVGLVDFDWFFEGHKPVGYFSDNTARLFTSSDQKEHNKIIQTANGKQTLYLYEWGYYFSP
jgi:hypothetical protein